MTKTTVAHIVVSSILAAIVAVPALAAWSQQPTRHEVTFVEPVKTAPVAHKATETTITLDEVVIAEKAPVKAKAAKTVKVASNKTYTCKLQVLKAGYNARSANTEFVRSCGWE